ncbi:hypothetical protein [Streptomyces sp. NPDC059816]|uniref:hypothetical protein n=1 Tax=Streptomyces sp. NPDC059816 TaxID=3346960 RepID=UPI00364C0D70
MTNLRLREPAPYDLDGGLAALRGDCARMVPHWTPDPRRTSAPRPAPLHGVVVPASSARLLDPMFERSTYGG